MDPRIKSAGDEDNQFEPPRRQDTKVIVNLIRHGRA
jgi:hypothetical protein